LMVARDLVQRKSGEIPSPLGITLYAPPKKP